jgi:hypothetical protein
MKVFLSWSGEMSHEVAVALYNWLPYVIQAVKPFISSEIEKGENWQDELMAELNDTDTCYGIVCVTPYNLNAPWLNFEAGAIAKAITRSYVAPFLFRVESPPVRGPLQPYQATKADQEEEVFRLLCSINNRLKPEAKLTQEVLRGEFKSWWPELQSKLEQIPNESDNETETGIEWLYTRSDLLRKQSEINCNEIWVITPNLDHRSRDPIIRDAVKKNLDRGIVYTFITTSSQDVPVAEVETELKALTEHPERVITREMPSEEFKKLAVTDYIIINPVHHDESHQLHVYLELPVVAHGYWIEVDDDAAAGLASRFRKLATEGYTGQPTS